MAIIRSSNQKPAALPVPLTDSEFDQYDLDAYFFNATTLDDDAIWEELTLPEPIDWTDDDQYALQWDRHSWRRNIHIDDRPQWEDELADPCAGCLEREIDLDPLGYCSWCRTDLGRCRWCGLDPQVYETDRACRTCYRQLRRWASDPRTRVTLGLHLEHRLLEAAFRRSDLRKRRERSGGGPEGA